MKILLVDDHALFREGMMHVLRDLTTDLHLLEAGSCAEALAVAAAHDDLELLLLDLALGGEDGLQCLEILRRDFPGVPVVVLSANETRAAADTALRLGASGYLTKSANASVVIHALRMVLAGGLFAPQLPESKPAPAGEAPALTARQLEVLQLLARGKPNKEIAARLGMAEPTVRVHVTAILKQLAAGNRTEAALKAVQLGLVAEPG